MVASQHVGSAFIEESRTVSIRFPRGTKGNECVRLSFQAVVRFIEFILNIRTEKEELPRVCKIWDLAMPEEVPQE